MSFQAKTDFFSITGTNSPFVITDSSENKSAQTVSGHDEKGDIVTYEVFAETMAPSCSYIIKADASLDSLVIGQPITIASDKFTIVNVSISTAAGSPPKIDISGEQIPSDTTHSDCKYTIPTATLKVCHHAQILWSSFTLAGSGCYLIDANYTASGTLTKATKDGETVAFDISEGQLTATLTIQQTGTTVPTITEGSGWYITSPLSKNDADASLPTWSVTLTKNLTHDTTSNT